MGKVDEKIGSDSAKLTRHEKLDQDETAIEVMDEKDIGDAQSDIRTDSTEAISGASLSNDENPEDIGIEIETVSDKELEKNESTSDSETSGIENNPQGNQQKAPSDKDDKNDFMVLDDDEIDDQTLEGKNSFHAKDQKENSENGESGNNVDEMVASKDEKENDQKEKFANITEKSLETKKTSKGPSLSKKMIGLVLVALIITGIIIYVKPARIGVKKESKSTLQDTNTGEIGKPVQSVPEKKDTPKPRGKLDEYVAKIKDAARLRDELLDKKEEISKLKRYFQTSIIELEDKIIEKIQKKEIASYSQAIDNKFIELSLRTIQRRRNYMRELEKPALWVHLGSEELLYLKRKAQVDMQMIEVAGGIDLERHMRHISAAVQKYQPKAENLMVHPPEAEMQSLETVWNQIRNRHENSGRMSLESTNDEIWKEICAGNFKRITELTSISVKAAQCLSKLKGTDLFLNGLTKISPKEARYLFEWRGNWICLNGVKELSPAVAKFLFEWEGNWISLNGLTEFPPELALFLMKWNGKQLELMGLNYHSKSADKKALKYLALWETTGGKLFVSDIVRKEMKRVMM